MVRGYRHKQSHVPTMHEQVRAVVLSTPYGVPDQEMAGKRAGKGRGGGDTNRVSPRNAVNAKGGHHYIGGLGASPPLGGIDVMSHEFFVANPGARSATVFQKDILKLIHLTQT